MLKQVVTYTDFDDKEVEETLYFNITRTEIADNLDIRDEIEAIKNSFEGPTRELETWEIRKILDLVKRLMKMGYGIREGNRFVKNEQIWTEFTQTAVYDEFLFSLFENPQKAFSFLVGIMPKQIQGDVVAAAKENQPDLLEQGLEQVREAIPPVSEDQPAWLREGREPNEKELREASQEQLREAFARKLTAG